MQGQYFKLTGKKQSFSFYIVLPRQLKKVTPTAFSAPVCQQVCLIVSASFRATL